MKKNGFKGCFCSKKAFTLIELLVVVLIIGVLSAVAVPQYQKAVYKSRFATIKNLAQSISTAQEVYYLANEGYAMDFNELDINMPNNTIDYNYPEGTENVEELNKQYRHYNWGDCHLDLEGGQTVCAYNIDYIQMQYQIYGAHSSSPGKRNCVVRGTQDTSTVYAKICESETKNTTPKKPQSLNALMYQYLQ